MRIVLADDHVIVRQGLSLLLAGAGFEVVGEASNGHEAVRLAHELEPDVVVLDVVMPVLNGLDAAREIQHASPRTRAILLTSRQDEQMVLEVLGVSVKTAESHRTNIMRKLGIRQTAGLVRYALQRGLSEF